MSQTKVIIKKQGDRYNWSQTDDSLTLFFLTVKNVSLKAVDVLYTEDFVKVNVSTIKFFAVIDFPHPIDYQNPRNRIQLHDDHLEVFLIKLTVAPWDYIQVYQLTKDELMKRREASLAKYITLAFISL